MLALGTTGRITVILFAFGLTALATVTASAQREATSNPQVVSGDRLTRQQFDALSDSALIEFKGRRMTKASIRVKEAQSRDSAKTVQALAQQSRAEFQQRLVQYEQERKAKHETDKAKATGEYARLSQANSQRLKAIEAEAAQLQERSKRASPAEEGQIEQRAEQLRQQLQSLEQR